MEKESKNGISFSNIFKLVKYYLISYWRKNIFGICLKMILYPFFFILLPFLFFIFVKSGFTEFVRHRQVFSRKDLDELDELNSFKLFARINHLFVKHCHKNSNLKFEDLMAGTSLLDLEGICSFIFFKRGGSSSEFTYELRWDLFKMAFFPKKTKEEIIDKWVKLNVFPADDIAAFKGIIKDIKRHFLLYIVDAFIIYNYICPLWDYFATFYYNRFIYFKKSNFNLFISCIKGGFAVISGIFFFDVVLSCLREWWKDEDVVVVIFCPNATRTDMFLAKFLSFYCLLVILFFSVIGYPMIMHWILFSFDFISVFKLFTFIFGLSLLAPFFLFFLIFPLAFSNMNSKIENFVSKGITFAIVSLPALFTIVFKFFSSTPFAYFLRHVYSIPFAVKILFPIILGLGLFFIFFKQTAKEDIKGE